MPTGSKRLTSEQRADAERLNRAWLRFRPEHPGATQEWLAEQCGITQGAVHQYLSGKIPLNLKALLKFCGALGIDDPREVSSLLTSDLPVSSPGVEEAPALYDVRRPARLSEDEMVLLTMHRAMPPKARNLWRRMGALLQEEYGKPSPSNPYGKAGRRKAV